MPRRFIAWGFVCLAAFGCGGAPTPTAAKNANVERLEKSVAKLSADAAAGTVPTDTRRLAREIGTLAAAVQGTPAADVAKGLEKQVGDFETMIEGRKKPTLDEVKQAIQKMSDSVAELKSKLGGK